MDLHKSVSIALNIFQEKNCMLFQDTIQVCLYIYYQIIISRLSLKKMDVLDHVLLYLKNTGMQVNSVKCELDQNSNIYLKCLVMWEVIKTHHYRVRAKIAIKTSKKNIIYHISLGWLISTGNCIIEGNICWIPWVNYQEGIPF